MVKWAIGSLAAYNALPASVQAEYAARYDEPGAAWTALQAIDPLGDDYTWELISDVTLNWPGGNVDFGGYAFTMRSRQETLGNPNRGYAININAGTGFFFHRGDVDTDRGDVLIEGIRFNKAVSFTNAIEIDFNSPTLLQNIYGKYEIRNCLFNGVGNTDSGRGIYIQPICGPSQLRVYNCKFWDLNICIEMDTSAFRTVPTYDIIENCTAYNVKTSFITYNGAAAGWDLSQQYCTIRNCHVGPSLGGGPNNSYYVYGGAPVGYSSYIPKLTIENCSETKAASDPGSFTRDDNISGYATNVVVYFSQKNIISNIVDADEFISLDDANDEFLFIGDRGTIGYGFTGTPRIGKRPLETSFNPLTEIDYNGDLGRIALSGKKPALAVNDITGYERGLYDNRYAIGCHEPRWLDRFDSQRIDEDNVVLG